jgi:hypothetical protein
MPDSKARGVSNLPVAIPDILDAPTVSATNVGTSQAYNNGAATVAFSNPTGGRPTSYSITTNPATATTTATSSPVTLTGLSSATSYTVAVAASNSVNGSSASTTSSSITATTVPQAPTVGTPTNATGQAYGATASISVPFTAGATGGSSITGYTVTSSSGNTGTGATSPITVASETISVAKTYTVTAANANGASTASSASSAVTPSTVPQAPTIGTFTDGGTGTTGTLSFTAGATGGSAITNYKVSTDNSTYTALSPSQTSSPLSLSGLSVGTATYYIKAVNANGDSTASSGVSGTVITPPSYESIATVTVGSGGQSTITFSSIPQTYKHLELRSLLRADGSAINDTTSIKWIFNSDTTSAYSRHGLYGDSSNASSYSATYTGYTYAGAITQAGVLSNTFAPSVISISDYSNTSKNKTMRILTGGEWNSVGTTGNVNFASAAYYSTSAITSFVLTTATGANFSQYSSFALYGVKG